MHRRRVPLPVVLAVTGALLAAGVRAQEPETLRTADGAAFALQRPPARDGQWVPLAVLLPDGNADLAAARAVVRRLGADLIANGFAVASPALPADGKALAPVFAALRRTLRVDQGGMHAVVVGPLASALPLLQHHRHEFQTFTLLGATDEQGLAALRRLPARRVHAAPDGDAASLARHLLGWHAERQAERTGASGDVHRTLDDFHDAAANGDERRYFAILPDDAVFLGTDGRERWTGAEFRAFAAPWFERPSAWTYVPLARHVDVDASGALAWFDEVLDHASYGECRGSGVLSRRDGGWVLRQYNLTIPVPNELARGVCARIRALLDGRAPGATTVVVVRHAEKQVGGDDPELSDGGRLRAAALARSLRDVPLAAVYHSEYRRTAATVEPLCRERALTAVALPAASIDALAARLSSAHAGEVVLVCGHSNTVPALLRALGAKQAVAIADDEYDRMLVVVLGPDGVDLVPLRYGG